LFIEAAQETKDIPQERRKQTLESQADLKKKVDTDMTVQVP
jgi:hypothetical protein